MKNTEVAEIFQDIADLLELKGGNPFKIRAYHNVVYAIKHLPVEVEQLVVEYRLKEVPGVGEAITKKLTELVTTGRLAYYERLKAEFPEGVTALLDIPGMRPRTAMLLVTGLGIGSIDELEAAIIVDKLAGLPHGGDKTAENITHHIKVMRSQQELVSERQR